MNIRRYYDSRMDYTGMKLYYPEIHDWETFTKTMVKAGYDADKLMFMDTAKHELILNLDEQSNWYFDCLNRVYADPRWYLDHLDDLLEFRVEVTAIFPLKKRG